MRVNNKIKNLAYYRIILLMLLTIILILRFGIKIFKGYPVWDFFPTYYAAKNILTKGDIYAYCGTGSYYTRSPFFALILYPLGQMPINASSFLWCLLSIAALGVIFIISEKLFLGASNKNNLFWMYAAPVALLLLSRPLIGEFLLGQADILMLCFIMLALFFKEKNNLILAAFLLAMAISIKLTPFIFLLYFLLKKEVKFISLVGLFTVIFLLIPAIFVSWKHNLTLLSNWYNSLIFFNPDKYWPPQAAWYQSLAAFFKRFLFSDKFNFSLFKVASSAKPANYLSYAILLAINIFLILKHKNIPKDITLQPHIIDYNVLIICMTIFSPLATDYSYINLIVPLIFVLYLFKERRLYIKPIFLACAILFLIFNAFTGSKAFRMIGIHQIQGEPYVYLVFMTLVWQALILLFILLDLKYKIFFNKGLVK